MLTNLLMHFIMKPSDVSFFLLRQSAQLNFSAGEVHLFPLTNFQQKVSQSEGDSLKEVGSYHQGGSKGGIMLFHAAREEMMGQ